jgi:hypothetical protein
MGFFSSLLSIEIPHRMVATNIKDYCTGPSLSDKEVILIHKLHLDQKQYIPSRNAFLIMVFNLLFIIGEKETANNPKSTVNLAKGFFQNRVYEHWDSLPEPEKTNMNEICTASTTYIADLNKSAELFFETLTGGKLESIDTSLQNDFREMVAEEIRDAIAFFRKVTSRLV